MTQSWSQIEPQLLAYGHGRKDAVADALRRFYERVLACGCRQRSGFLLCADCRSDQDAIIDAWNATEFNPDMERAFCI